MLGLLLSLFSIYFFILLGYLLKREFREKIDDNSLTLVSIYGLQPMLAFWGIMLRPLDASFLTVPASYLGIILLTLGMSAIVARRVFAGREEHSIATVAPLIGNTGNLGIPLGIVLLGQESVFYTNAINLCNVFFVYTFGVFFYSLGRYTVRDAVRNIVKIPVLWVAGMAILLNLASVRLPQAIDQMLMMGAYAGMVVQLLLFGTYLASVRIASVNLKLLGWVSSVKFLLLPAFALIVLGLFEYSPLAKSVLLLELLVPLAVTNATLATLYGCKPEQVTAQVFFSALLFIVVGVAALGVLGDDMLAIH